jgi:flagellar basal body-associated protein FliL
MYYIYFVQKVDDFNKPFNKDLLLWILLPVGVFVLLFAIVLMVIFLIPYRRKKKRIQRKKQKKIKEKINTTNKEEKVFFFYLLLIKTYIYVINISFFIRRLKYLQM